MFNDIYNPNWNQVFQFRLDQIRQSLSQSSFPTKEEYQALVESELNRLMRYQDKMQPLRPITRETPALVGDVQGNLDALNSDVQAVTAQLLDTEQTASELLNLYGSALIALRQRIRQMAFAPTNGAFVESFIGGDMLAGYTNDVDLNTGVVTLPIASQTAVLPSSVRVGVSSDGAMLSSSNLSYLIDGRAQTLFEWQGKRLELVFEFDSSVILNRIKIEPHVWDGLIIEELQCSPDGIYQENVLDEVDSSRSRIDASSAKFAGEYVVDFTPKETRYLKLVLRDCVGAANIGLRGISFLTRKYLSNGYVNFQPVTLAKGTYAFETTETSTDQLTSIQHQVSDDGIKFRVIYPGTQQRVNGSLWYRIYFRRNDADFAQGQNPFFSGVTDPNTSSAFRATQPSSTTDLGGGIYQREIPLDTLSGSIRITDRAVDGTMEVLVAGQPLTANQFSFKPNILSIQSIELTRAPLSNVTLRYQTSLAGQVNFNLRKPYFSSFLYDVRFRKE